MWNERYNTDDYVYGTEPDAFLLERFRTIPVGKLLCLGEGESNCGVCQPTGAQASTGH